jgi:hypothetical protein
MIAGPAQLAPFESAPAPKRRRFGLSPCRRASRKPFFFKRIARLFEAALAP